MKTKSEIVHNWLPLYTGLELEAFGRCVLLVNFNHYVEMFAGKHGVPVCGADKPMPNARADGITIINFGMGSANAATIMDLLSAVRPKAVLFLGKCGGLKERPSIGDFILPIAALRGEGTSNDYFPPEVPALPAFNLQKAVSTTAAAILYCIPTFQPDIWPHRKINLGLDLQGGMHLVLEVDTAKAVESAVERSYQDLRELVRKNQIQAVSPERPSPQRILVRVQGKENIEKFKGVLEKELRELKITTQTPDPDTYVATLELPGAEADHIKKLAVDQALETIRNRVDQFGGCPSRTSAARATTAS